jgi:Chs5-Arf1p-binding protein BUD7/BCH1
MEEEYRMQKAQNDIRVAGLDGDLPNGRVIYEDGTARKQSADDNASTKGLVSPNASPIQTRTPISPGIPVIKVSSESDRDRELEEMERGNEEKKGEEESDESIRPSGVTNPIVDTLERAAEGLEKPSQAAASDDSKETKKDGALPEYREAEGFSFANKRLCERWLDNLFMCLYEVILYQ